MSQLSDEQKSEWADHLRMQRNSGFSQQAYCKQHSLRPHQFSYWKRKLQVAASNISKHQGFVPVKIATSSSAQGLSIALPNGITLSGIAEHNQLLAQQLVGALK